MLLVFSVFSMNFIHSLEYVRFSNGLQRYGAFFYSPNIFLKIFQNFRFYRAFKDTEERYSKIERPFSDGVDKLGNENN